MTNPCSNPIRNDEFVCGDVVAIGMRDYCSDECADRESKAELAELGITPDMMREAVEGYYECRDMIDARDATRDKESRSHDPSSPLE